MKIVKMNVNNWTYNLIYSTNEYGSWPRQYVEKIEWIYEENEIKITIAKGTLWHECISPNGNYLVLIFQDTNSCNCVIYNLKGEIIKVVCPPILVNDFSWQNHDTQKNIMGEIVGIENPYGKYIYLKDDNLMILKIADPKRMFRGKWTEHRIFNPETGEIGELLYTNVSEDL